MCSINKVVRQTVLELINTHIRSYNIKSEPIEFIVLISNASHRRNRIRPRDRVKTPLSLFNYWQSVLSIYVCNEHITSNTVTQQCKYSNTTMQVQ